MQYILLAPYYINVLNVYAVRLLSSSLFFRPILSLQFASVSWVTNGNNVPLNLDAGTVSPGAVPGIGARNQVTTPVPKDIDEYYEDAVNVLGTKKSKQEKMNEKQNKETYYSNFNFWTK